MRHCLSPPTQAAVLDLFHFGTAATTATPAMRAAPTFSPSPAHLAAGLTAGRPSPLPHQTAPPTPPHSTGTPCITPGGGGGGGGDAVAAGLPWASSTPPAVPTQAPVSTGSLPPPTPVKSTLVLPSGTTGASACKRPPANTPPGPLPKSRARPARPKPVAPSKERIDFLIKTLSDRRASHDEAKRVLFMLTKADPYERAILTPDDIGVILTHVREVLTRDDAILRAVVTRANAGGVRHRTCITPEPENLETTMTMRVACRGTDSG